MSAADTAIGSSLDEEMQAQQLLVEEQDSEGSQGSVKHKDPAAVAAAVRKQVEFYFSDANLPTDKHLLKQIHRDPEGYVPLKMIAGFKRVKALTKEVAVVAEALQGSNLLALDDSKSRIRRITPLPTFDASDIIRRTVVAEHLPDQPTIESVTQLLAQYGEVVMVRVCARGNSSKLPSWLGKAVDAINLNVGHGEYALVEFASEDDCVQCVDKTKNPDNWRTSLRVRHLLPTFKPASSSKGGRTAAVAGDSSNHHGSKQHSSGGGAGTSSSSSRPGSRCASRRSSLDGAHHSQHHRDHREHAATTTTAATAAAAGAAPPAGLSPIKTQAAAVDALHMAGSPRGHRTGLLSPGGSSPTKSSSGVGGAIGSPRMVKSPAPAEVASLIDSILSAPTAGTPTRGSAAGTSSGSGSNAARWMHGSGGGSSSGNQDWGATSMLSPAAAVAAALAGVSTPPQTGSPRAAAMSAGVSSTFKSQHGQHVDPKTPTRLSGSSAGGAAGTPITPASGAVQGALAAQIAAAAAAAAAAMAGSPRAAATSNSNAATWRGSSGNGMPAASVSAPVTPLGGLTAGDAVEAAFADLGMGSSSTEAASFAVGSPDPAGGSMGKPGRWISASLRAHMQQVHDRSGSEAEDNVGSWRSSYSGGGTPPGPGFHKPPKHRSSAGAGGSSSGNKERRRSWHASDGDDSAAGPANGSSHTDASSDDGSMSSQQRPGGRRAGARSRLGEYRSTVEMIKEGSQEFDPALLAVVASEAASPPVAASALAERSPGTGSSRRRSASYAGDGGHGGDADSEEHDDEKEEGQHADHGSGKKRRHRQRRRSTGSGSRRQSLDGDHGRSNAGNASGGNSRRHSMDGKSSHSAQHDRSSPNPSQPNSRTGARTSEDGSKGGKQHGAGGGSSASQQSMHGDHGHHHQRGGHATSNATGEPCKEGKKKEKKDYANWAAATPEFRAAAAAGKHNTNHCTAAGASPLGTSPARAGLSPSRANGGGAALAEQGHCPPPVGAHVGHDGDGHVKIAKMPDGTRGFGLGRGRAMTPPPEV